ncbi:MAG: ABC transporter permease [Acidobacteria bacterium]|nr:ABC transporter permease [Acidobacteriota bacterium]
MPDWRKHLDVLISNSQLQGARASDVREEVAAHLDDRYHALLAEGLLPAEAERRVLIEAQAGALSAEAGRVLRSAESLPLEPAGSAWLAGVWRDVRYGWRQLRLTPAFTLAALLSLALGIGANAAIFELLDAVRMRALPVKAPQELASIRVSDDRTGEGRGVPDLTTALFETIRARQQAFTGVAAWTVENLDLSPRGEVRNGRVMLASGNLFELLGVGAAQGRLFTPQDDRRACANPPAVVSYAYWQTEMGGRSSAIGEQIWVNRHPFVVAGVTPASFFGLEVGRRFSVAPPLCTEPLVFGENSLYDNSIGWWLGAVGRLKPGWTAGRAEAQIAAMAPAIMQATMPAKYNAAQREEYAKHRLAVVPAGTGFSRLRNQYDRPFWFLLGLSALVLLIACANLANLMLARAAARTREMAVRLALGASRSRLLRQLMAESLLLALLGATAGTILAQFFGRALVPFLGSARAHLFLDLHVDWRVLAFTATLAAITCLLFGLSPALAGSRVAPAEAMKAGGRGVVASRSGFAMRRGLVAAQIALSLSLVVAALLFARTFRNLLTQDAGFDAVHVITVNADFAALNLPAAQRVPFKQRLTEAARVLPGIEALARALAGPVNGGNWNDQVNVPLAGTVKLWSWFDAVSPGYFAAIHAPLIAGRDFTDSDSAGAPLVAIISHAFAIKMFHDPAPIGKTFGVIQYGDKPDVLYQVVGVAADVKYEALRSGFDPVAYLPDMQAPEPQSSATLMVRTTQPPDVIIPELRRALLQVNPGLALQFSLLKDDVADGLVSERLMAMLAGFFGVLAIVLAVVGLYGVIAYMVARRTNEIGIRMALGAGRRQIVALVMKEVCAICGIGLIAGVALALAASPAARSLLFGLRATDPATLGIACLGVGAVALLAACLPALRAARLDPMVALHED